MESLKERDGIEAQFINVLHDIGNRSKNYTYWQLDDFVSPPIKSIEELIGQVDEQNSQFSKFGEKRQAILSTLTIILIPIEDVGGIIAAQEIFSPVAAIFGAIVCLINSAGHASTQYDSIIELLKELKGLTTDLDIFLPPHQISDAWRNKILAILATLFEVFVLAATEVRRRRHPVETYVRWFFGRENLVQKSLGKLRALDIDLLRLLKQDGVHDQILSETQKSSLQRLNKELPWTSRGVYEPLRHHKQEIRLLTLTPPTPDDTTLGCTLQHVPLPKAPPYVALSYHWGNAEITTGIQVNGVTLQVTVNLEAALRRLQAEGVSTIWADALCIDQTNTNEKSLQVPRIGTIFRKASEVAIWLGDELDLDETSMEYLRAEKAPELDQDTCLSTLPIFKSLLARPYWRRVWIIQELAVASRITLYCGRFRIPWRVIDANCDCCQDGNFTTARGRPADETVCRFTMLRQVRTDVLTRQPIRLLNAMHQTRSSLATDPRDKIFALLGLTFDGKHFVPEPSYMSSMADSFTEFATSLITNGEHLDFIYLRSGKRKVDGDLPSWVPDWTDLNDALAHRQFDYIMLNSAPGVKSPETYQVSDLSISGSELNVKGVLFDIVNGLGTALTFEDGDASAHEIASPDETENPYETQEEISEVVYKTLVPSVEENEADGTPRDFHRLWSMETEQQLQEAMPAIVPRNLSSPLHTWIAENRSFMVHGQTMESWIRKWSEPSDEGSPVQTDHRFFSNVRCCMRLLMTERGYLGWAHPQARRGDRIAIIFGCRRPVILRACWGGYRVVGDASLSRQSTGNLRQLVGDNKAKNLRIL